MFENFLPSKKNIFGLDIGYNSLKVVELKKSGLNYKPVGYNQITIPVNSVQKNGILYKEEISKSIKIACDNAKPNKISAKYVVSALPASLVFTKILKLPPMKQEELAKAIPFEVADFFPVPVVDLNLDWHILDSVKSADKSKKQNEILVIGAPKTLVKDYVAAVAGAGMELVALETKPLAAARSILETNSGTSVLVDIGAEISSISIADEGLVRLTSTIKTGGNTITEAIAQALNITKEEAEKIKKESGLELGKKDDKNMAINKVLKTLSEKIDENIKYYENRIKKSAKINEILLCGGGAQLMHIDNFIENELGISTKLANPWTKIKMRASSKMNPQESLKYTTALGLAMREL